MADGSEVLSVAVNETTKRPEIIYNKKDAEKIIDRVNRLVKVDGDMLTALENKIAPFNSPIGAPRSSQALGKIIFPINEYFKNASNGTTDQAKALVAALKLNTIESALANNIASQEYADALAKKAQQEKTANLATPIAPTNTEPTKTALGGTGAPFRAPNGQNEANKKLL